jgi:DNA-binding response OmpR family regulator
MAAESNRLQDMKVLVVEDNFLVADSIKEVLESHGCEVVGPVSRVERGLKLARECPLDGALLDVNLAGDFCFPIAIALSERGVPFLFLTGYDDPVIIPVELRAVGRLPKPFDLEELAEIVAVRFRTPPAGTN